MASDCEVTTLSLDAGASSALLKWHHSAFRSFPWRSPTVSPWEALLAEILLARTGAARVNEVYEHIVRKLPSPQAVMNLGREGLESLFSNLKLGLHKQRSALLLSLSQTLVEKYASVLPEDVDILQSLPGVGKYVAHAVAVLAWNEQVPIVDANVVRILARFFDIPPVRPDRRPSRLYWEIAKASLPVGKARDFNLAILDLAALVCKPRNPSCINCPLAISCKTRSQGDQT